MRSLRRSLILSSAFECSEVCTWDIHQVLEDLLHLSACLREVFRQQADQVARPGKQGCADYTRLSATALLITSAAGFEM